MIRFCPNCQSERPLTEFYCQGVLDDGSTCNWDLTTVEVREPDSSAVSVSPTISHTPGGRTCSNGHPVEVGDLICMTCGAVIDDAPAPSAALSSQQAEPTHQEHIATEIAGWTIQSRLPATSAVTELFLALSGDNQTRGVLTLYGGGSEPDPAVYDAIRRMSDDHLPHIYEIGRWQDRAFEISEEITGGSLSDAKIDGANLDVVRIVVFEIGKALASFSQSGLRHRDISPSNVPSEHSIHWIW